MEEGETKRKTTTWSGWAGVALGPGVVWCVGPWGGLATPGSPFGVQFRNGGRLEGLGSWGRCVDVGVCVLS